MKLLKTYLKPFAALVLALVSGVLYLTGWGEAWRN